MKNFLAIGGFSFFCILFGIDQYIKHENNKIYIINQSLEFKRSNADLVCIYQPVPVFDAIIIRCENHIYLKQYQRVSTEYLSVEYFKRLGYTIRDYQITKSISVTFGWEHKPTLEQIRKLNLLLDRFEERNNFSLVKQLIEDIHDVREDF